MYLFIISVILVTIISMCVFKNRFWENRYLVLLIIAATSLVSMTTVNFSIRGSLPHMVETYNIKSLIPFHTELLTDSNYVDTIVPNLGEVPRIPRTYNFVELDSIPQITSHIVFFGYGSTRVGYNVDGNDKVEYYKINDIYFNVSDKPRFETRVLTYDTRNTPWVTAYSLPKIETICVLYIPQHEYDAIPEEYKREIPF